MPKVTGPQNDPVLDSAQPRANIFKRALDQVLTFLHIKSKPIEMRDIAVSEKVDYKAQNQDAVEVFLKRKNVQISPNFEFQTKHVAQIAIHASNPKDAVDLANKFLKAMSYHKGGNKAHPDFVLDALMIDPTLKGKAIYNIQQDYNDTITALKKTFPGVELSDKQNKQLMKILIDLKSSDVKKIRAAVDNSDLMKALTLRKMGGEHTEIHFNEELGLEYVLVNNQEEYFVSFDNQESVWLNYSEEDEQFWYEYADEYYIYNPATKASTPYYADEASAEESVDNVPAAPAPPPLPPVAPPVDGKKPIAENSQTASNDFLAEIQQGTTLNPVQPKTPEQKAPDSPVPLNTDLVNKAAEGKLALPGADMQGADDDEWD